MHKLTLENVEALSKMFLSQDETDAKLAMDIVLGMDKSDEEGKKAYKEVALAIAQSPKIFRPTDKDIWVVKVSNQIVPVNGKVTFYDKESAEYAVTKHLNKLIGVRKKDDNKFIDDVNVHMPGKKGVYFDTDEDDGWGDKKQRIEYHWDPYLRALKDTFKSGTVLKTYMYKNNIIEIVNLRYA